MSEDNGPGHGRRQCELEIELVLARRDRDAAQVRLLARRLTDAMAWRRSQDRLNESQRRLDESEDRLERMRQALAAARDRIEQMEASTSWRITGPLREVMRRIRGEAPPLPVTETIEVDPPRAAAPTVPRTVLLPPPADRPRQETLPDLPHPYPSPRVAVLLAPTGSSTELERCVASALLALRRAGSALEVTVLDLGTTTTQVDAVRRIRLEGVSSLARMHNLLLQDGFARGAEVCVVADPAGLFHPDAICALLGVLALHGGRALVDALRFPDAHPKAFDPLTLETAWVGGHCLAISRAVFDTLGGFDEELRGSDQDAELSRRAKALGWPVLTAPHALFLVGRSAVPGEPASAAKPPVSAEGRAGSGFPPRPDHAPAGSA